MNTLRHPLLLAIICCMACFVSCSENDLPIDEPNQEQEQNQGNGNEQPNNPTNNNGNNNNEPEPKPAINDYESNLALVPSNARGYFVGDLIENGKTTKIEMYQIGYNGSLRFGGGARYCSAGHIEYNSSCYDQDLRDQVGYMNLQIGFRGASPGCTFSGIVPTGKATLTDLKDLYTNAFVRLIRYPDNALLSYRAANDGELDELIVDEIIGDVNDKMIGIKLRFSLSLSDSEGNTVELRNVVYRGSILTRIL